MKKMKILITSLILFVAITSQAAMVLEYNIIAKNTKITLPLNGSVNVAVNWGDGSALETFTSPGDKTHVYTTVGYKTVKITGTLRGFGSSTNTTGNERLITVSDWDGLGLTNLAFAFYNATNLTKVPFSLPSTVSNLNGMFYNASAFNQSLSNWNTATITNMASMFKEAKYFNQSINNWNTSSVTDMSSMFSSAESFDEPIGNWDTKAVTDMSSMFNNAYNFNQALNSLNTSAVTNMKAMFYQASAFNKPINTWNTAAVTDMSSMFNYAYAFNQPIGNWNTSAVTDMSNMFYYAKDFNQPIGTWNTSAVKDMNRMLFYAKSFNQPINNWNTSAVINMESMFASATTFNQPIDSWNTSSVTNMSIMFSDAIAFNQPINTWNTAAVVTMSRMFSDAAAFNQTIKNWNIEAVTDMKLMFYNIALCTNMYDDILNSWSTQTVKSNVILDGGKSKHSIASKNARDLLLTKGFTVMDAGDGFTGGLQCGITTSTQEALMNTIELYPNPTTDKIHINFTLPIKGLLNYEVYNTAGTLILKNKIESTNSNLYIELATIPSGLYIIKLTTEDKTFSKTFIKE